MTDFASLDDDLVQIEASLPGLYAAGDALDTRAVGSRYPSFGFSMRTASVTGARAGKNAAEYSKKTGIHEASEEQIKHIKEDIYIPMDRKGGFSPAWTTQQLQNILTPYYIWSIRHGARLNAALALVEFLKETISPN